MNLRKPWSRWALWVFAAALLLKAAMPLLAGASAQAQGKTLVEVCTVYGVSLVPLERQGHEPAHDPSAGHDAEHCALDALAALATPTPPVFDTAASPLLENSRRWARVESAAPDGAAVWMARLGHGPPALA
jgi:hypothetical protein